MPHRGSSQRNRHHGKNTERDPLQTRLPCTPCMRREARTLSDPILPSHVRGTQVSNDHNRASRCFTAEPGFATREARSIIFHKELMQPPRSLALHIILQLAFSYANAEFELAPILWSGETWTILHSRRGTRVCQRDNEHLPKNSSWKPCGWREPAARVSAKWHENWVLETVRCIIGVNTWRSSGHQTAQEEEIRRLKRELEVTR
jgi:hypothetical protein